MSETSSQARPNSEGGVWIHSVHQLCLSTVLLKSIRSLCDSAQLHPQSDQIQPASQIMVTHSLKLALLTRPQPCPENQQHQHSTPGTTRTAASVQSQLLLPPCLGPYDCMHPSTQPHSKPTSLLVVQYSCLACQPPTAAAASSLLVCFLPSLPAQGGPGVCQQQAWHSPSAAVLPPRPAAAPQLHEAHHTTHDTLHATAKHTLPHDTYTGTHNTAIEIVNKQPMYGRSGIGLVAHALGQGGKEMCQGNVP